MRIFLAVATGVIGRPLVPALLGAGHEVTALARTQLRGNSNAKAKAQLDFAPRWPRWREGFAAVLADVDGARSRGRLSRPARPVRFRSNAPVTEWRLPPGWPR